MPNKPKYKIIQTAKQFCSYY